MTTENIRERLAAVKDIIEFSKGLDMWCGNFICQTRNGTDTVLRRHMIEGEYNVSSSQKLVYMPDQLRAVRDVLDATTGNRVQSYDYDPYGGITRSNGSTATDYEYARLFSHPIQIKQTE